jgi:hypothetical protein
MWQQLFTMLRRWFTPRPSQPAPSERQHLQQLREVTTRSLERARAQEQANQVSLPPDELRTMLEPRIAECENGIRTVEQQLQEQQPDVERAHLAELLGIQQRNLAWYRQMLAGERAVVPVNMLNQIWQYEQQIQELDSKLARLA